LLKKYKKLWVFGDSYTTPNFNVTTDKSFWGLVASHCKIDEIINCSRPGNSFDTICHLLIGSSKEVNWEQDLLLVGIPPLERITVFDNFKNTAYQGSKINTSTWDIDRFDIPCHRGLECLLNFGKDKQLIIHSDRSWLETQNLRHIFLLTQWLDKMSAQYLLVNLAKEFDKNNVWGPSEGLLEYCIMHKRFILFDKTYYSVNIGINQPVDYDTYGWHGHHGVTGNKHFFEESVLPKLIDCNLI
jgi:hypothetical protein